MGASDKAEAAFKKQYPAVYSHMLQYKEPLSKRNQAETGIRYEWYAMQRWGANYWNLFFKPKICWKAVGRFLTFSIVEAGTFLTAPASFISAGDYNEHILAYLCSKVAKYYIYKNSDTTGAGDIMLNIQSLIKFPVPNKVNKDILKMCRKMQQEASDELQAEIDKLIYQSYGFDEDEIAEIESV